MTYFGLTDRLCMDELESILLYLITSIWTVRVDKDRPATLILIHQTRVLEVSNKSGSPLYASIRE